MRKIGSEAFFIGGTGQIETCIITEINISQLKLPDGTKEVITYRIRDSITDPALSWDRTLKEDKLFDTKQQAWEHLKSINGVK